MTKDQVLAAVKKYDGWLDALNVRSKEVDTSIRMPTREQALGHLRWMFGEMATRIAGATGKSDRWIGFVQGVLWFAGFASIDEFKDDNR